MLKRRICVFCLMLSGIMVLSVLHAAEPDSGTVSENSPVVSWSGGPVTTSNPSGTIGGSTTDCRNATIRQIDPACDIFHLTIEPPAGKRIGVTITTQPDDTTVISDYDVFVFGPDGKLVGDAQTGSGAETVILGDPSAGTFEVVVEAWLVEPGNAFQGEALLEILPDPEPEPGNAGGEPSAMACEAPGRPLKFSEPVFVDTSRAGGEPSVVSTPDGVLLYAAHAGTTHFFAPAGADEDSTAFAENYTNQVYAWFSEDDGVTWNFVDRALPPDGLAGSGFSDPDFAFDAAGNVYLSEINLANVAVSKSTDSGRSYELQNFFGMTMSDRQWKTAGPENVVFIVGNVTGTGGTFPTEPVGNSGHTLFRSTDGGRNFSVGISDPGGLGDIKFDDRTGTLYEANLSGGVLRISAFRNALAEDVQTALTPEQHVIAEGVSLLSHWPAIIVGPKGNVYIVWDESGRGGGGRAAGIWYSYSADGGRNWAQPVRVDPDDRTDIWPWIAVGDAGRVAIAWFGNDNRLPEHDAEQAGADDPWNVVAAQTLNGLGCPESDIPGFQVARATPEPFHVGTVCQGGTICQAQLVDRRLGDYFTIDIDNNDGALVAAYSDTRMGGAVALPAFFRQTGGASFFRGPPLDVPAQRNVTGNIKLRGSNARFADGTASLDLQIENRAQETIAAPLRAEIVQLQSQSGNVTAANADNGEPATGAFWRYDDRLNGDGELAAGEISQARNLAFTNQSGEPFSINFRVFSGPEPAAGGADSGATEEASAGALLQLTVNPLTGSISVDLIDDLL